MTLRSVEICAFPFEAMIALTQLSLEDVSVQGPDCFSIESRTLVSLVLRDITGAEMQVKAPGLKKLLLKAVAGKLTVGPLPVLENLRVCRTPSLTFEALPLRHLMVFETVDKEFRKFDVHSAEPILLYVEVSVN
jgi:hypothetical protein